MLKIILMFLLCKFMPEVYGQTMPTIKTLSPPGPPLWPDWVESLPSIHVTNLTRELLADIMLKLEHAKAIQGRYKYGQGYEIGTVASAIKDSFEYMLQIYRNYVDEDNFDNNNATKSGMPEYMRAYAIIQGEYNKIRQERNLFVQIRLKFAALETKSKNKLDNMGLTPKQRELLELMMKNKSGGRGRRLADTEMLLDETYWNSDLDLQQIKIEDQTEGGSSIALKKSAKKQKALWKPKDDTRKVMNLDQFD